MIQQTKMFCKITKKITHIKSDHQQEILTTYLNYKNKMHKSSILIQNFLDYTLILHNEFFYYVLERIQLMSLLYPLLHLTWAWLLSDSTSSDSITGKIMSITIFDLTSNERMNWLTCWMQHVGWNVQMIKLSSSISANMLHRFN